MSVFRGNGGGTLTYRDFQTNARTALPTKLAITLAPSGDAMTFAYTYDDGPGKIGTSAVAVAVDPDQGILSMREGEGEPDLYRFTDKPDAHATLQLTLWGRG